MYPRDRVDIRACKGTVGIENNIQKEFCDRQRQHIDAHTDGAVIRFIFYMSYADDHCNQRAGKHGRAHAQDPASGKIADRYRRKSAYQHNTFCTNVQNIRLLGNRGAQSGKYDRRCGTERRINQG